MILGGKVKKITNGRATYTSAGNENKDVDFYLGSGSTVAVIPGDGSGAVAVADNAELTDAQRKYFSEGWYSGTIASGTNSGTYVYKAVTYKNDKGDEVTDILALGSAGDSDVKDAIKAAGIISGYKDIKYEGSKNGKGSAGNSIVSKIDGTFKTIEFSVTNNVVTVTGVVKKN